MGGKQTLFDKIWARHLVPGPVGEGLPSLLYVDLHLVHEVTSPQAFAELDARGLKVRRPSQTVATMDHSTPTLPGTSRSDLRVLDPEGAAQLDRLSANCERHGVPLFDLASSEQGIVHVIGPEQGLTQPGNDGRLRRQPHLDSRRLRCTRLRHRHVGGGARPGHAVSLPAQTAELRGPHRR